VERLKGIIMELDDGAYPLLSSVKYYTKATEAFVDCDVIVFIGGFPRQEGQERKSLLSINGKIFSEQGKALQEVGKETVKCLVVANPANTNCWILRQNAPKIPSENFTALTRLDENRAYTQIA
jgi:malate/lactate dehydrogenase